ncbi:MAG: FHA domain-containing protein [Myxococcota bacterium]
MDKAELLATFTDRMNQFEKYQGFIVKAREQAGKFASAVVEKVVADNSKRCMDLVGEIMPLTGDLESVLEDLRQNREAALDSAKESQFRLEELELRLAIGDLSDADFRAEASDYKAVVESTDAKVAEIDSERSRFADALERWSAIGSEAGIVADSAPSRSHDRDRDRNGAMDRGMQDRGGGLQERHVERHSPPPPAPSGRNASRSSLMVETIGSDSDEVIAAHDIDDDVLAEPMEASDLDDIEIDNGSSPDGFEVDGLNLVPEDDEAGFDDAGADKEDKPRRAVLLYQEGTAEEQIYPFTGEVMSLGRGRDNDVQVKNDSKVSRYHCKLYRRGPNFYIEDNKSANGTLVNGELITERRLFGGEEVIIGETFFRFRILD